MNPLLELNDEQKRAVTSEGVVLIIAGPGTGKTKTLISRIRYLIQEKSVLPQHILALTFTQKAATEMKDRLADLSVLPYISTFHSLAFDTLQKSNLRFRIATASEQEEILHTIQEKHSDTWLTKKDIRELMLLISNYKNNDSDKEPPFFITEYNRMLQEKNLYDFDDLLLNFHLQLSQNESAVAQFKSQFSYILVDEFQDTNMLQYQIIKRLLQTNNLLVIGDPYQSIYAFRGADSSIFKKLKEDFKDHKEIVLSKNYRSAKEIITGSSLLFKNNIQLVPTNVEKKGEVCIVTTVNEFTEAEWIVNQINNKIGGTDLLKAGEITQEDTRKTGFSDFAVLYRTHSISRILEKKFAESGIPFQIIGNNSAFKQKEVQFIISLLEYCLYQNQESLMKVLSLPILKISSKTQYILGKLFPNNINLSLQIVLEDVHQHIDSRKDIKIISTFFKDLEKLVFGVKNISLQQLVHKILDLKVLKEYLDTKHANPYSIHSFLSTITQFYEKPHSLQECLSYLQFLHENEFYDPNADKVTLLTLHASKGLEFKHVFICGFEEGSIPYIKDNSNDAVEEEKRLFYVGMTRAKENLYLLSPNERNKQITVESRFYPLLKSDELIEIEDEAIVVYKNRTIKWKEKKSQLQLF